MSEKRSENRAEPDVMESLETAAGVSDYHVPPMWQHDARGNAFGPPVNRAREAYAARAVKRKDHVYAGLFAIFLGAFGMHKFYLGYNNAAFIMLSVSIIGSVLSAGIAAAIVWIMAIVEGVTYLTKSQADFDRIYVNNTREWF
jgi:TM2 domain-containing membrane protein YozV